MDKQQFERLVAQSKDPDIDVQCSAWDSLAESLDPAAFAYVLEAVEEIAANPQAYFVGLGRFEDIFIQAAPRSIGPLLEYFETGNPTSEAMWLVATCLGEIGYLAGENQDTRIIPATVKAIERWRKTSIASIEWFLITLKNCMFVRPTRPALDPLLLSLTEQALAEGKQDGTYLIDIMNRNETPGLRELAQRIVRQYGGDPKNLWVHFLREAHPPIL